MSRRRRRRSGLAVVAAWLRYEARQDDYAEVEVLIEEVRPGVKEIAIGGCHGAAIVAERWRLGQRASTLRDLLIARLWTPAGPALGSRRPPSITPYQRSPLLHPTQIPRPFHRAGWVYEETIER